MNAYVVNRTDNFHSLNSFRLLGVATSLKKAIKIIKKEAKEDGVKLSDYDKSNLEKINQTQGSDFDGEFNITNITMNRLV